MKQKITNWGKYPTVETNMIASSDFNRLRKTVVESHTIIARGNGHSYGDNSLNKETIFSTLKLNKFISFDKQNGIFECESGVLLADILDVIVPEGFFLPVTPGTKLITVGGGNRRQRSREKQSFGGMFRQLHLIFFHHGGIRRYQNLFSFRKPGTVLEYRWRDGTDRDYSDCTVYSKKN